MPHSLLDENATASNQAYENLARLAFFISALTNDCVLWTSKHCGMPTDLGHYNLPSDWVVKACLERGTSNLPVVKRLQLLFLDKSIKVLNF